MSLDSRSVLGPVPGEAPPARQRRLPRPYFSAGFIVVCAVVYLLDPVGEFAPIVPRFAGLSRAFELYGPAVAQGQWWRIFTGALTHGGLLHIALNMWVVYSLGFPLERLIGTWRMTQVSVIGILGAAGFTLLLSFDRPTVGASGMILAWAGVFVPILPARGRRVMMGWLLQVALISLLPFVSWQGHLGGFLSGLPCGLALKLGPKRFAYLAPVILFAFALLCLLASNPARLAALIH